jgi:glycosyltransferase involved in cell wall biosynthesis
VRDTVPPVRILIDYRPALRERTGVGEYVHQLARALAGRRVDRSTDRRAGDRRAAANADDVEVFTSSWRDRPAPEAVADLGPCRLVDRRVPVGLLNFGWHRLGWPPIEWLTGHAYDVVHSPHPLLIPSRRAARVVTIHDLDFLLHPERTRAEIRRDYAALASRHAAAADGVIVVSAYVGELVERILRVPSERISVCPNGVAPWPDGDPILPGNPRGEYILFLGTLEPRKNVEGLLGAYADLVTRRPDAPPLVLVGGSTPGAEAWREMIAVPPLAGRVEYRGYVADRARRSVYAGARLVVLPSFDEGFGFPVVEAMSLGVPVVASTRGALPEVSGGAARLVDPEDLGGLSRAMEAVVFDAALAARMGEAGLVRARAFSWSQSAELTRAAYERAIETRRHRSGG